MNDKLLLVYGAGGVQIDPSSAQDVGLLVRVLMDHRYVHARIDRRQRTIEMYTKNEFDSALAQLAPVTPREVHDAVESLQRIRMSLRPQSEDSGEVDR